MSDSGVQLYFAYGSNMYEPRLQSRVPSARYYDVARLPGYCLVFAKRGADGSAKCDLEPFEPETAWGVVYCIDAGERPLLDEAEGEGYQPMEVRVATGEQFLDAFTYRARPAWRSEALLPYAWYRDTVAAGAREHGLPEVYIAAIEAMDSQPDPDEQQASDTSG